MTPQQWAINLAPSISNVAAWHRVGIFARQWLKANVVAGDMVSTRTLVEGLYPKALAEQSDAGLVARNRIIEALTANHCGAHELADCMTLGSPQTRYVWGKRKTFTPPLWHAPKTVLPR